MTKIKREVSLEQKNQPHPSPCVVPLRVTVAQLLAWISAALLLQVTAAIGVVLWRRRGTAVVMPVVPDRVEGVPRAAWAGWREFKVRSRGYEDAAQSQCSFTLEPLDGESLPPFKPGQFLTFSLDLPDQGGGTSATPAR